MLCLPCQNPSRVRALHYMYMYMYMHICIYDIYIYIYMYRNGLFVFIPLLVYLLLDFLICFVFFFLGGGLGVVCGDFGVLGLGGFGGVVGF